MHMLGLRSHGAGCRRVGARDGDTVGGHERRAPYAHEQRLPLGRVQVRAVLGRVSDFGELLPLNKNLALGGRRSWECCPNELLGSLLGEDESGLSGGLFSKLLLPFDVPW